MLTVGALSTSVDKATPCSQQVPRHRSLPKAKELTKLLKTSPRLLNCKANRGHREIRVITRVEMIINQLSRRTR
jgi:hypothetical protein